MVVCKKLYSRYKFICGNVDQQILTVNIDNLSYAELVDFRDKVYKMYLDSKHCFEMRNLYKQECINPQDWDAGHDFMIDQMREVSSLCFNLLTEINNRLLSYSEDVDDLYIEQDEKINYDDEDDIDSHIFSRDDKQKYDSFRQSEQTNNEIRRARALDTIKNELQNIDDTESHQIINMISMTYFQHPVEHLSLYQLECLADLLPYVPNKVFKGYAASDVTYSTIDDTPPVTLLLYGYGETGDVMVFSAPVPEHVTVAELIENIQNVMEDPTVKNFIIVSKLRLLNDHTITIKELIKYGTEFAIVDDMSILENLVELISFFRERAKLLMEEEVHSARSA